MLLASGHLRLGFFASHQLPAASSFKFEKL
jgi:hypothetical protein